MLKIEESKKFTKDLKLLKKRGKDLMKLYLVVEKLAKEIALDPVKNRPHPLIGNWKPYFECHIEADWLLIYLIENDKLKLVRSGTHSDLF